MQLFHSNYDRSRLIAGTTCRPCPYILLESTRTPLSWCVNTTAFLASFSKKYGLNTPPAKNPHQWLFENVSVSLQLLEDSLRPESDNFVY